MAKFPAISLPVATEFVLTREVPLLIADALYPYVKLLDLPVIDLYKIAKEPDRSDSWIRHIVPLSKVPPWYTPLSTKDYQVLQSIWLHLPKLEYPISRDDWKPYANAFAECGTEIGFDLKENCIEWLVEPNGNQKQFFEQNNHSHNMLGMWMNDDAEERNQNLQCGMAEMQHIVLLRDAIRNKEVTQHDPITHAPTKKFRPFGKIGIEEFISYTRRYHISVTLIDNAHIIDYQTDESLGDISLKSISTADVSEDQLVSSGKSDFDFETFKQLDIPGKFPKVAIRKLAIIAAWGIEKNSKKLASAEEVMKVLQLWVDGDCPELISKERNSVKWVTTKGLEKIFTLEACSKALEAWRKSRR